MSMKERLTSTVARQLVKVNGEAVNKLTSVFHPSVLLLIMNFVITLSK